MTRNEAGRYGASLTAFILGGYLLFSLPISAIWNGIRMGDFGALGTIVIAVIVVLAAVILHPAPTTTRVIASIVLMLGLIGGFTYLMARLNGDIRAPRELNMVLQVIGRWEFVVVFMLTLAWLIVRRRWGVSYLLLILTPLVGLAGFGFLLLGVAYFDSVNWLILIALIIGVGVAWLAARMSRGRTPNDLQYGSAYTAPYGSTAPPAGVDYPAPGAPYTAAPPVNSPAVTPVPHAGSVTPPPVPPIR